MQPTTIRIQAARMRSVLHEAAHATHVSTSVTVLAYAAVGLPYPGEAPQTPVDLARCMGLLAEHLWMRERAFEYLRSYGAWPYLIAAWDELAVLVSAEIGPEAHADSYAPRTFQKMHEVLARRCTKPHCNHPIEKHAHDVSHCTAEGCHCGYFLSAF